MYRSTSRYSDAGFTLLELMIALAIAAILFSVGVPSFKAVIQSNRAATQTNTLVSSISLARMEAMKRAEIVSLGATGRGTNWSDGWAIFQDEDGDGLYDSGEEIRLFDALSDDSTLTASQANIDFDQNGFVDDAFPSDTVSWTLRLADCSGDINRNITLFQSGRSDTTQSTCP